MGSYSGWESLLLGAIVILIIFWLRPGIKASWERSRNAEADWGSLVLPLGLVVLFVIFLISMV